MLERLASVKSLFERKPSMERKPSDEKPTTTENVEKRPSPPVALFRALSRTFSNLFRIHEEKPAPMSGEYKVTLESSSNLGTFVSVGKALVTLHDKKYEIKAILRPQDAPIWAIRDPMYVHAVAEEKPGNKFNCVGKVYISKYMLIGTVGKIVENDVTLEFSDRINPEKNHYSFSLNPFSLFGYNPGKVSNTGDINRVALEPTPETLRELEFCEKNLKLG